MQGLADLLLSILDYGVLLALALALGGVAWGGIVLRPWRHTSETWHSLARRCASFLAFGAAGLAVTQVVELATTAWFLSLSFERSPFPAFLHTPQFQSGLTRALLAAALAAAALVLRKNPEAWRRWAGVAALAIALAASGAWLSHAVDRTEGRASLMVMTALHQAAGLVWAGGLLHLYAAWRLLRRDEPRKDFWPAIVSRFSWVAVSSVFILVGTGYMLAQTYVASWRNVIGTGYGVYVLMKTVLLVLTLGFGALNFRMVRNWRLGRSGWEALRAHIPRLVEGEIILLLAILLIAVALLSLPLAADVALVNETASWHEVAEILGPKWPRLHSPTHEEVMLVHNGVLPPAPDGRTPGNAWSEYNHNVTGLFLVVMGFLALAAWTGRADWVRHWPLGFVPLVAFIVARSDPETWPLGPLGFWQGTFGDVEVLQHRLAALLALALGLIEWRSRTARKPGRYLPYVLPVLSILGGMLLFVHFHTASDVKSEFLIEVSHSPLALFAVVMGCSRWVELRAESKGVRRWAGFVFVGALLVIGALLSFYREPPGA